MKNTKKIIFSCLVIIVFFSLLFQKVSARAQSTFGTISGTVEVESEEVKYIKEDVQVIFYDQKTRAIEGKITLGSDGSFSYGGLDFGSYIIRVESTDYGSIYYQDVLNFNDAEIIELNQENSIVENLKINIEAGKEAAADVTLPSELEKGNEATTMDDENFSSLEIILMISTGVFFLTTLLFGFIGFKGKKKNKSMGNFDSGTKGSGSSVPREVKKPQVKQAIPSPRIEPSNIQNNTQAFSEKVSQEVPSNQGMVRQFSAGAQTTDGIDQQN